MAGATTFTEAKADEICRRLAAGELIKDICKDAGMPCRDTIYKWIKDIPGFSDRYARAKELQCEWWAEEIVSISDDGTNDFVQRQTRDGSTETVLDHEHVTRSRLRVDSRKWLLSKLVPKKYGDKVSMEHTGKDGGPIEARAALSFFAGLPREESYVESEPKADS